MSNSVTIKPWIFEFLQSVEGAPDQVPPEKMNAVFNTALDSWVRADSYGLEGIFFSEHHFWLSYSPSPNLLVANIAARTERLRLGVMGMVLPFYQPFRILEEIFMLDHLTRGRLEIGCSMGVPAEFTRLGLSMEEVRERFDELLAIMDAGLESAVFSHHGKYWNFDDLSILPQAYQRPRPPKWTTVVSTGSAEKSAERGSKISTGFASVARVREIFEAHAAAADRANIKAGPDWVALRRNVFIADTAAEADAWKAAIIARNSSLLSSDPRVKFGGANKILDVPKGGSGFEVSDDEFIAGTPSQVAEEIVEQCRGAGCGHFFATLGEAPGCGRADTLDRFGTEVVPLLRRAGV